MATRQNGVIARDTLVNDLNVRIGRAADHDFVMRIKDPLAVRIPRCVGPSNSQLSGVSDLSNVETGKPSSSKICSNLVASCSAVFLSVVV